MLLFTLGTSSAFAQGREVALSLRQGDFGQRSGYVRNMHQPIKTPCVKVCVVDGQSGHCLGCGRNLGEIARWARFSDAERDLVLADLPARIDALKAAGKR